MATRNGRQQELGYTLLELMIVVAIVAILAAWAISSYSQYVRKARRADAQQRIDQIVLAQERYRAEHPDYTVNWSDLGGDPDLVDTNATGQHFDWPDVVVDNTADPKTYSIVANAVGDQQKDSAGAVSCKDLAANQAGAKTPAACWSR